MDLVKHDGRREHETSGDPKKSDDSAVALSARRRGISDVAVQSGRRQVMVTLRLSHEDAILIIMALQVLAEIYKGERPLKPNPAAVQQRIEMGTLTLSREDVELILLALQILAEAGRFEREPGGELVHPLARDLMQRIWAQRGEN